MTTTYTPTTYGLTERNGSPVQVINTDDVTLTTKIEFSDGLRAIVPNHHLTHA